MTTSGISAEVRRSGLQAGYRLATVLHDIAIAVTRWPRSRKQLLSAAIDFAVMLAGLSVIGATYETLCSCYAAPLPPMVVVFACAGAATVAFLLCGLYRSVVRHWSYRMLLPLAGASAVGAFVSGGLLGLAFSRPAVLFAIPLIGFTSFGPMLAWRLLAVALLYRGPGLGGRPRRRIAVYGAGSAGAQLVAWLQREARAHVVALLDDNPDLHGRRLHGRPIHPPGRLSDLIATQRIEQVVVAIPSATVEARRRVLNRLAEFPIKVQTLPPLSEIVSGQTAATDIREVSADELLSREPVKPDLALMRRELQGQRVLVTGGGGSIGSALCREILRHRPARLVVFEISEYSLYQVDRELRRLARELHPSIEIVSVLGSVLSERDIANAVRQNAIDIVYHAAAYKHVPLVEANPLRGVENNVFGTLNVAAAAQAHGVRKFVLISTDKAVRPTNVMGASKRMAEKVVEALCRRGRTRFTLVRFGNVIDSAGSVVPLFRDQIRSGGPVTVTHPDVVRFFMTIPEAAELVVQAGAMAGEGVDVFHLDMGDPVRIADLAAKLIHLSGYKVADEDPSGIEVQFVGLRPGEKLFEELLVTAMAQPTAHPRIFRARDVSAEWGTVQAHLTRLREAVDRNDVDLLKRVLGESVEDYRERDEPPSIVGAAGRIRREPQAGRPGVISGAHRAKEIVNH